MSGQQKTVLWIGLILVGLNLVRHWSEIRGVIFSGAGITSGIPGQSVSPPNTPLVPPNPKGFTPVPGTGGNQVHAKNGKCPAGWVDMGGGVCGAPANVGPIQVM